MKLPIIVFILSIAYFCECRVASSETEEVGRLDTIIRDEPLKLRCTFRTLNGGDPYPSVIVKWHNQVNALTWASDKKEMFVENYKQPSVSHSYPSSQGLSGGSSPIAQDPFSDATVVPDSYAVDDILSAFKKDCVRPY